MSQIVKAHIRKGPFEYRRINGIAYESLFGFKFFKKVGKAYRLLGVNWVSPYAS